MIVQEVRHSPMSASKLWFEADQVVVAEAAVVVMEQVAPADQPSVWLGAVPAVVQMAQSAAPDKESSGRSALRVNLQHR